MSSLPYAVRTMECRYGHTLVGDNRLRSTWHRVYCRRCSMPATFVAVPVIEDYKALTLYDDQRIADWLRWNQLNPQP